MDDVADSQTGVRADDAARRVPFKFHGEGGEFFRIWIVNLVLTVLTLGIYSAWAKVRTNRYFYGSTELAGDRFEYLADPITILKGRLIAVAALIIYTAAQTFLPLVSLILLALLLAVIPWIVVRSLRFNAIMSSWRGIRFGFDGKPGGAAAAYLGWPLFGAVTLGLGVPYAWYKQNQFVINNHRFGQTPAETSATAGQFYAIMFMMIGIVVLAVILLAVLGAVGGLMAAAGPGADVASLGVFEVLVLLGYFALYVGMYVVYQAMRFQVVYNSISLANNRVRNDVTIGGWFGIVIVNAFLMILTLGFFYPWAKVRLTRYMLTHLWVDAVDLDSFVAAETDHTAALGEELGEAFDLGIGV